MINYSIIGNSENVHEVNVNKDYRLFGNIYKTY